MQKTNSEKPTSSHSISKTNNGTKSNICICEPDKSSIISIVCRICYDGDRDEPIITPCRCKGTVAYVHRTCLETWLAESNTTSCELCHYVYRTERTPKYTARESIWRWFRHQPLNIGFHVRGLRSDVLACAILTPLAIVITYVCLFSADYYNQKKFSNIPAAKWTSVSLLVMISIMLMGYYLWVYMVIRYHGQVWYYCWQRECVVRYIAPSTHNVCLHHSTNNQDNQISNVQTTVINESNNNINNSLDEEDIIPSNRHNFTIVIPASVTPNLNNNNQEQTVSINMNALQHTSSISNTSENSCIPNVDSNNQEITVSSPNTSRDFSIPMSIYSVNGDNEEQTKPVVSNELQSTHSHSITSNKDNTLDSNNESSNQEQTVAVNMNELNTTNSHQTSSENNIPENASVISDTVV